MKKISSNFETLFSEGARAPEALVLLRASYQKEHTSVLALEPADIPQARARHADAAVQARNRLVERLTKRAPKLTSAASKLVQPTGLPIARMRVDREGLAALAEQDDVLCVIPNQRVKAAKARRVRRDPIHEMIPGATAVTWGLEALDVSALWSAAGTRGEGVRVGVVDTGVYAGHTALKKRVSYATLVDSLGRRITPRPAFDAGEHGTHVCGVIAGGRMSDRVAIGVAPEATLAVAGVLLGEAWLSAVFEGIGWCAERECRVVNLSLGFSYYEPKFDLYLKQIADTFGTVIVAAVGNRSHGNTDCPGNVASALSVGAITRADGDPGLKVASFSGGATMTFPDGEPQHVVKPDLVAPGVDVISCVPPRTTDDGAVEYAAMEGTSMAAPHVSGALAVLMSAHPDVPPEEIVTATKESAHHPSGSLRPDNRWGWGLIQPRLALSLL